MIETAPTTQEVIAATQRAIVNTERKIVQALREQPTPELVGHLLDKARQEAAQRLQSQSTYLYRLEDRTVDEAELVKAKNVQDRFRSAQTEMLVALGESR